MIKKYLPLQMHRHPHSGVKEKVSQLTMSKMRERARGGKRKMKERRRKEETRKMVSELT